MKFDLGMPFMSIYDAILFAKHHCYCLGTWTAGKCIQISEFVIWFELFYWIWCLTEYVHFRVLLYSIKIRAGMQIMQVAHSHTCCLMQKRWKWSAVFQPSWRGSSGWCSAGSSDCERRLRFRQPLREIFHRGDIGRNSF